MTSSPVVSAPATAHAGIGYRQLLPLVHAARRPELYLEIGIGNGASLACATCSTIAVDPNFRLAVNVVENKPECLLFRTTSDAFFAEAARRTIFPRAVDLAFLDGLHWFEVLLRDFINTEKRCSPDGIIMLHDCLPYSAEIAERVHRPAERRDQRLRMHWAGDVWKLIPILKQYRPDLRIVSLDSPPTGLVFCMGLDPSSDVLTRAYDEIVATYAPIKLDRFTIMRLFALSDLRPSRGLKTPAALTDRIA